MNSTTGLVCPDEWFYTGETASLAMTGPGYPRNKLYQFEFWDEETVKNSPNEDIIVFVTSPFPVSFRFYVEELGVFESRWFYPDKDTNCTRSPIGSASLSTNDAYACFSLFWALLLHHSS